MQNYVTPKGEMLIIYFNAKLLSKKQEKYKEEEIKNVKWFTIDEIKNIPRSNIRGGDGINKILYNIEEKIEYSLNMLDTYNYLEGEGK